MHTNCFYFVIIKITKKDGLTCTLQMIRLRIYKSRSCLCQEHNSEQIGNRWLENRWKSIVTTFKNVTLKVIEITTAMSRTATQPMKKRNQFSRISFE